MMKRHPPQLLLTIHHLHHHHHHYLHYHNQSYMTIEGSPVWNGGSDHNGGVLIACDWMAYASTKMLIPHDQYQPWCTQCAANTRIQGGSLEPNCGARYETASHARIRRGNAISSISEWTCISQYIEYRICSNIGPVLYLTPVHRGPGLYWKEVS